MTIALSSRPTGRQRRQAKRAVITVRLAPIASTRSAPMEPVKIPLPCSIVDHATIKANCLRCGGIKWLEVVYDPDDQPPYERFTRECTGCGHNQHFTVPD